MGVIKKILFRWKKAIDLVKTLRFSTTSTSSSWSPLSITNNGATLTYEATNGVTQTIVADDPTFNLSTNTGTVDFAVYDVVDLEFINLSSYPLSSVDLSECSSLDRFACYSSSLSNLDITNTILTQLYCNSNNLTTLDISNNLLLTALNISNNNISTINVTLHTELTFLQVNNNFSISTLDVSNCTLLEDLNVEGLSLLTSIDLSNATVLDHFFCTGSGITTLDVSNCPLMEDLRIYNTPITSVNVTGLTILPYFLCSGMNLTTLDISTNVSLLTLWCQENSFSSTVTNSILANLVSHGLSGGTLRYRNNETGQGITDRATLISRGWTITNYPT